MRPILIALAGLLLAAPSSSSQEASSKEVQGVLDALEGGDADRAVTALATEELRTSLSSDPRDLDAVCLRASRKARLLAHRAPAAARRLASVLLGLADDAVARSPEDGCALRARQFSVLVDARVRSAQGMAVTPEPFVKSAEVMASWYRAAAPGAPASGDPLYLLWAAEARAEGAAVAGEEAPALWDSVLEDAALLRGIPHRDPGIQVGIARLFLDRLRWGASRREKGLDLRLDALLAYLAAEREKSPRDKALSTVFNETVTEAGRLGIRRKDLQYHADRTRPCPGLEMSVPVGLRWTGGDGPDSPVAEYDPEYGRIRCLEVAAYSWSEPYEIVAGTQVKGDSLRDIALKHWEVERGKMASVETSRPPAQGRLKTCAMGLVFEMEGTGHDGKHVGRREWFFKSAEGHGCTYRVALSWHRKDLPPDPEFDFLMASIREVRK